HLERPKKLWTQPPQPLAHPSPPLPPLPVRTDRVADPWVEAPHAADHRRPAGPRRERAGGATAPGGPPGWPPPCRDRPPRPTGLCLRRTRQPDLRDPGADHPAGTGVPQSATPAAAPGREGWGASHARIPEPAEGRPQSR